MLLHKFVHDLSGFPSVIDFSDSETSSAAIHMFSLVHFHARFFIWQLASASGEHERTLLQRRIEATDQQTDRSKSQRKSLIH